MAKGMDISTDEDRDRAVEILKVIRDEPRPDISEGIRERVELVRRADGKVARRRYTYRQRVFRTRSSPLTEARKSWAKFGKAKAVDDEFKAGKTVVRINVNKGSTTGDQPRVEDPEEEDGDADAEGMVAMLRQGLKTSGGGGPMAGKAGNPFADKFKEMMAGKSGAYVPPTVARTGAAALDPEAACKVKVSDFEESVGDDELRALLEGFGFSVRFAKVFRDRRTNRSRRFGMVMLYSPHEVPRAIEAVDGFVWGYCKLHAEKAKPRQPRKDGGAPTGKVFRSGYGKELPQNVAGGGGR